MPEGSDENIRELYNYLKSRSKEELIELIYFIRNDELMKAVRYFKWGKEYLNAHKDLDIE